MHHRSFAELYGISSRHVEHPGGSGQTFMHPEHIHLHLQPLHPAQQQTGSHRVRRQQQKDRRWNSQDRHENRENTTDRSCRSECDAEP